MNFKTIIKEEIQNIVDGVGDQYAEKQFNIPDKGREFQDQWQNKLKTDTKEDVNGKFVGTIYGQNDIITNIYMNPKTLKNFDRNVRAVTDENGNLYITQLDANIFHSAISYAMRVEGIYIGDAYDVYKNIAWHRVGGSNEFGLSISYIESCFDDDNVLPEYREGLLNQIKKAEQKNPHYKFVPVYWSDYKRRTNF